MDSLASAFSAQAGVSSEPNSIHKAHPRYSILYLILGAVLYVRSL